MSIFKQLAIHAMAAERGLPVELSHEILGFCFYDTITAVYRAVHRGNMLDIIDHFNDACLSRALPDMIPDNAEHWGICLSRYNHPEDDEVQFQTTSCGVCGNYKACNTYTPDIWNFEMVNTDGFQHIRLEAIPTKLRCICLNH